MSEMPIVFGCAGDQLVGIVHAAPAAQTGVVIVVGGPQYRVGSHRQFVLMARDLARAGFAVLRFDYRGMGDSEGPMQGFEHARDDIRAAIDALQAAQPSVRQLVLWGLCDAAAACLMFCTQDARVSGVVLANPWVRTEAGEAKSYLRHYYLQRLLQRSFWRKVLAGGFSAGKSLRDLSGAVKQAATAGAESAGTSAPGFIAKMRSSLLEFAGPVLVLISGRDLTAGEFVDLCKRDARWRAAMARTNVLRIDLPDADHTFSNREALTAATRHCVQFVQDLTDRRAVGAAQRRRSTG